MHTVEVGTKQPCQGWDVTPKHESQLSQQNNDLTWYSKTRDILLHINGFYSIHDTWDFNQKQPMAMKEIALDKFKLDNMVDGAIVTFILLIRYLERFVSKSLLR